MKLQPTDSRFTFVQSHGECGPTSEVHVTPSTEDLSSKEQRVSVLLVGPLSSFAVDMSRGDAIMLARGILSSVGFVLDGAPI